MWTHKDKMNSTPRGFPFSTPPPEKKRGCPSPFAARRRPLPASEEKWKPPHSYNNNINNMFHVIHKVPAGDSPYVRAKHVQLVDKNPSKAVSMFWAAINLGDRVDSALKDMAVVMKQLNRADEAIEAIKSFRHLCPSEAQEPLDNILLELYKRSGRIEEQIELLQSKLKHIEDDATLTGNRTKLGRSQGKKIQITMGQEYSRLLGNLAWAHLQQDDYKLAEEIYRKALSMEPDKNKQCNLAICLMYMNKMTEAKFLLNTVKNSNRGKQMDESYAKSFERAIQVLDEFELFGNKQTSFSSFLSKNKETCSSPFANGGTPRIPITQPRMNDWRKGFKREDSGGGRFRKLLFDQAAEVRNEIPLNRNLEARLRASCSEISVMPSRELENEDDYGDENMGGNMILEKIESLNINDGYQTQPGSATCKSQMSRVVKRSLTFDRSQRPDEDEDDNYWCCSPSEKKTLDYESARKVRLQVFQDITLSSESQKTLN